MAVATNSNAAHPLNSQWSLFYDSKKTFKPGAASWLDSLVHAHTVNSVEEFWAMVCTVKKPSQIDVVAHPNPNYHFFRQGIKPMWEDPQNKEGGKWVINLNRESDLKNTDFVWEEVLMGLVGEYLDEQDLVTGAVFSKRYFAAPTGSSATGSATTAPKGLFRIAVWVRQTDTKAKDALLKIAAKLRGLLQLPETVTMEFFPHEGDSKTPSLKA